MALIDCPECGGQVSDRAPTCPHCGVPIVAATAAPQAAPQLAAAQAPRTESELTAGSNVELTKHDTVEPLRLRIAGRPIPMAALLFWGGMVVGIIFSYGIPLAPDAEPEWWRRYIPWLMIWSGVLWFAVTEFGALMKQKLSKR